MDKLESILAHKNKETGQEQTLFKHLLNTAAACEKDGASLDIANIMYLLGLFHDLGKLSKSFQMMISGQKPNDRVNHSSLGAIELKKLFNEKLALNSSLDYKKVLARLCNILIYVITAHHGYYDVINDKSKDKFNNTFWNRLNKFEFEEGLEERLKVFYEELFTRVYEDKNMSIDEIIDKAIEEFIEINKRLDTNSKVEFIEDNKNSDKVFKSEKTNFYNSLYVRLFLSILKNNDILDTVNAYEEIVRGKSPTELERLKEKYLVDVEDKYKKFPSPNNEIDKIRAFIAEECKKRGSDDGFGIYRLNLPTGAGKTLASLRYGMNELVCQNKSRFFYVTAFLSVLEQNASEIKNILTKDKNDGDLEDFGILEHHSNVIKEDYDYGENDKEENYIERTKRLKQEFLIDTWDSPIVLTTMVQFFNSLIKEKSSNIRRFSSLSNSVIVLDEVQSLPIELTYIFNLTMNFIASVMKSLVILCTATQPKYDHKSINHKMNYKVNKADIVSLKEDERRAFDRTEVFLFNNGEKSTIEQVGQEILQDNKSYLVILNTKNAVQRLYDYLKEKVRDKRKVYYLSTNLCAKHRKNIIEEIRSKLRNRERKTSQPIICVSTQLVEAGVDFDFDRLIRSYAGIDSIIQAMGRCNRNGYDKDKGIVKLVNFDKDIENLLCLKAIKDKKDITEYVLDGLKGKICIEKLNDKFYQKYYANNKNKMYYSLGKDKGSLFDLLSENRNANPYKNTYLRQKFKSAGESFELIEDKTEPVIVYYDNNGGQIEELINAISTFNKTYEMEVLFKIKSLIRKLQLYTVNAYGGNSKNINIMEYKILSYKVNILAKDAYDKDFGIKKEIGSLLL